MSEIKEDLDPAGRTVLAGDDLSPTPRITVPRERAQVVRAFASWGKLRRLHRLATHNGTYLWLAADHGLTFGPLAGLTQIRTIIDDASDSLFSGVVLNCGMVRFLREDSPLGLILQTFGLPEAGGAARKVRIFKPEDISQLGPDAVAVELNPNMPDLGSAVQEAASTISTADALGIPVLLMITPMTTTQPSTALQHAIRVGSEIGADIIKVGLHKSLLEASRLDLKPIRDAIASAPPVVLAGGVAGEQFSQALRLSRDLGFSGVCAGRNIFQASSPRSVFAEINSAYS